MMIATTRGIQPGTLNDFTALDPDINYSFENDTSKYLTVNMYNNYFRTSAFSELQDYSQQVLENMNIKGQVSSCGFQRQNRRCF